MPEIPASTFPSFLRALLDLALSHSLVFFHAEDLALGSTTGGKSFSFRQTGAGKIPSPTSSVHNGTN